MVSNIVVSKDVFFCSELLKLDDLAISFQLFSKTISYPHTENIVENGEIAQQLETALVM